MNVNNKNTLLLGCLLFLLPSISFASAQPEHWIDLTQHWVGFAALAIFIAAYVLVMAEEFIHLRKSKPVVLAAGIIWALIGYVYATHGFNHEAEIAVRHNLLEYAELMVMQKKIWI